MKVKQFFVQGWDKNFSYLLWDTKSQKGVVVDPNGNLGELLDFIQNQEIQIQAIVNTHGHRDHTELNQALKDLFQVPIVGHKEEPYAKDKEVVDGEVWEVGEGKLQFLHTPGHSPGSICILTENHLVTGDTLFVGRSGKTSFPGGSPEKMFQSMVRLRSLPDETVIYPGHDYGDWPTSTIGKEKEYNQCLMANTVEEFKALGI
ncbi:MAG: MBL fold metallo-hydrolase [Planctomycetota bacterium]|nr:MAG: MBL fold metallo-hydrolase [Planctomycetota bacterium]